MVFYFIRPCNTCFAWDNKCKIKSFKYVCFNYMFCLKPGLWFPHRHVLTIITRKRLELLFSSVGFHVVANLKISRFLKVLHFLRHVFRKWRMCTNRLKPAAQAPLRVWWCDVFKCITSFLESQMWQTSGVGFLPSWMWALTCIKKSWISFELLLLFPPFLCSWL